MKITNLEHIKNGEKELIDNLTGDLDWHAIETIFKEKHHLSIQDDVEFQEGDIVVFQNKVTYKLDFQIKVNISLLFDRNGECLALRASEHAVDETTATPEDEDSSEPPEINSAKDIVNDASDDIIIDSISIPPFEPDLEPNENISQTTAHLAEMVSDINKE